jgi:hypothetical protein
LSTVIAQHPILSAVPVGEDEADPYFARLPQIDLAHAVKFVHKKRALKVENGWNDEDLDQMLEEQHSINFKRDYGQLPFWRLIITQCDVTSSEFIASFIVHHALCDGNSAMAFHRTFFTALNDVTDLRAASDASTILTSSESCLLPSLEDALPLSLSFTFILKSIWKEFFGKAPTGIWTGPAIAFPDPIARTRFRSMTLNSSTIARVLATSRKASTTLTGTVEVLLADAMFEHLPSGQYSKLVIDGPISLKRFLPQRGFHQDAMGTYVSMYQHTHTRRVSGATSLAQESRKVKATIDAEVSKQGRDSATGLLWFVSDMHAFFKDKEGKSRGSSAELSNIGVFKPPQYAESNRTWNMGTMIFSQSANVTGVPLEVSMVTGVDGGLTLGFSWMEGVVEDLWVEKVAKSLKLKLESVGG